MQVLVRENNVDQALRVLKKKMQREGIFREMKLRNYFEKPSEKQAWALVQEAKYSECEELVVVGLGAGYHLEALFAAGCTKPVHVIEPDPAALGELDGRIRSRNFQSRQIDRAERTTPPLALVHLAQPIEEQQARSYAIVLKLALDKLQRRKRRHAEQRSSHWRFHQEFAPQLRRKRRGLRFHGENLFHDRLELPGPPSHGVGVSLGKGSD